MKNSEAGYPTVLREGKTDANTITRCNMEKSQLRIESYIDKFKK